MNMFMEQKFATAFIGVNTFTIRQRPTESFTDSKEQRREGARRPPLADLETNYLRASMTVPVRFARECSNSIAIQWEGRTARGISVVATEETYFGIKKYTIDHGRAFSPPEDRAGVPVVVLGALVANKLFRG